MSKVLEVRNVKTYFNVNEGVLKAVDGVSFEVDQKEVLGLVGETGCGKSTTALSIIRLLKPHSRIMDGEILFKGENLLAKTDAQMRAIRWSKISMIFQNPSSYLNPAYNIGNQISEAIKLHTKLDNKEALEKTIEMLKLVRMPDASATLKKYPHELSIGMMQRAMIAMALSCNPELLMCDEPTTALDVTIQAQILDLIRKLKDEIGSSIILITHNFGIVAELCSKVAVMYAGKIVELADVYSLFEKPHHPYTRALINAIPTSQRASKELESISGSVPSLIKRPLGCVFHPRCKYAKEVCSKEEPQPVKIAPDHIVCCHIN